LGLGTGGKMVGANLHMIPLSQTYPKHFVFKAIFWKTLLRMESICHNYFFLYYGLVLDSGTIQDSREISGRELLDALWAKMPIYKGSSRFLESYFSRWKNMTNSKIML
jgi:hypothetical protein